MMLAIHALADECTPAVSCSKEIMVGACLQLNILGWWGGPMRRHMGNHKV